MMRKQKGFTLVEMLVTITVLGIVTVIALPVISAVSSQLNNKKLNVYENTIESGAKVYTDAHDLDLFGYQTVGCVDIYYNTLVSNKVIDELDFSKQNIITDKIFVRVKKVNDNYSYETFFPTSDNIADINFNLCEGSISDSGPRITFTPNGTNWKKKATATINIDDMFGISPNAKIKYQWFYVDGTPIGTEVTHNFKNSVAESLSLNVDTPTGMNAKIRLVVTPIELTNEISMPSTDAVQSDEFKLDNTAPIVNIDAYKESGGNRTGGVLASANNGNIVINDWKTYGYYFDFTRSTDNVAITKEEWSWNKSGNGTLDPSLTGGSGTYTPITNHTLTASGVRYGSIKLCDEAGNCTTKTVQVSISNKYTINYNANGGSGNVASTTCYYGFGCNLANNGYSRDGFTYTGWQIDSKNYSAGANVANLTTENGKTYTAYAQWKSVEYTITIGNNGSNTSQTLTKVHNQALRLPKPSRDGYAFVGWNENAAAHNAQYTDFYNENVAKTLYPIWKKNSGYTIYYHRDKGEWFGDWTDGETCYVWNQETSCNITVDSIPRLNRWSDTSPSYNYDWVLSYQGWNWNPGHSWKDFSEGQVISLSSSINLYAVITLTDPNKRFHVSNTADYSDHAGLTMRDCPSRGCGVSFTMRDGATFQADNDWNAWAYDGGGYIWIRGRETGDSCWIGTWDWADYGKVRPYWMRPPDTWRYTLHSGRDRWYDHCACYLGSSNSWNVSGWGDCYSNTRWSSAMYLYPI